ncbi:MAG: hypothetical protein JXQ83_08945 [Candidatus Glassbacteria bacterium]|nr:hypothetical protein [Candidatus Glassbacteria bacterium]
MAEYPHILAENTLEEATVAFTDGAGNSLAEDPVYGIVHLADRSRLSKWRGDPAAASQRLIWSFAGGPRQVDTLVLDRNFDLTGDSPRLTLQYAESGAGPWTTAKKSNGADDVVLSGLDSGSIYWTALSPCTKQHWSVLLQGLSGMQRPPSIFNLWLGRRIELTFGPSGGFDPCEEETVGENVHGAAGGFQRVHRYRRRVLRAGFDNLNDAQYELIGQWWCQAGRDGKNWWWLTWPVSRPDDPLYLNCEGGAKRFGLYRGATRSGTIEAWEVK